MVVGKLFVMPITASFDTSNHSVSKIDVQKQRHDYILRRKVNIDTNLVDTTIDLLTLLVLDRSSAFEVNRRLLFLSLLGGVRFKTSSTS